MLELAIETPGISPLMIERCERTFELSRLIEFAAIAIAGLTLHAAGGHELIDVARRGILDPQVLRDRVLLEAGSAT